MICRRIRTYPKTNEKVHQFRNRCEKIAASLMRTGKLLRWIPRWGRNEAFYYVEVR